MSEEDPTDTPQDRTDNEASAGADAQVTEATSSDATDVHGGNTENPFETLPDEHTASIADRSGEDGRGDPFEQDDGLFSEVEVDADDPDRVWEELTRESLADDESDADAKRTVIVPVDSFCDTCPYLSSPTDIECEHEGTSIVEFVDTSRVKLVDCPVVERKEEMGVELAGEIEDVDKTSSSAVE